MTRRTILLPRIAPVAIPIAPTTAGWVRIEATVLEMGVGGRYLFQLYEIWFSTAGKTWRCTKPVRVSSAKPARIDLSGLPAGDGFQFEIKIKDTTKTRRSRFWIGFGCSFLNRSGSAEDHTAADWGRSRLLAADPSIDRRLSGEVGSSFPQFGEG